MPRHEEEREQDDAYTTDTKSFIMLTVPALTRSYLPIPISLCFFTLFLCKINFKESTTFCIYMKCVRYRDGGIAPKGGCCRTPDHFHRRRLWQQRFLTSQSSGMVCCLLWERHRGSFVQYS